MFAWVEDGGDGMLVGGMLISSAGEGSFVVLSKLDKTV
jgi:hypothetical protein